MGLFKSKPKPLPIVPTPQSCPVASKCYETFIDDATGQECLKMCLTHCKEWSENFLSKMPTEMHIGVLPPWIQSYSNTSYWTVSHYVIHIYTTDDSAKSKDPLITHILLTNPTNNNWTIKILNFHGDEWKTRGRQVSLSKAADMVCSVLSYPGLAHKIDINAYIDPENIFGDIASATGDKFPSGHWVVPKSTASPLSSRAIRLAKKGQSTSQISFDNKVKMLNVHFGPFFIPAADVPSPEANVVFQ